MKQFTPPFVRLGSGYTLDPALRITLEAPLTCRTQLVMETCVNALHAEEAPVHMAKIHQDRPLQSVITHNRLLGNMVTG